MIKINKEIITLAYGDKRGGAGKALAMALSEHRGEREITIFSSRSHGVLGLLIEERFELVDNIQVTNGLLSSILPSRTVCSLEGGSIVEDRIEKAKTEQSYSLNVIILQF